MRLLYLTPTSAMGGAERVLLDLLSIVRAARPSWTLGLIVGNDGPLTREARALGVDTTVRPFPRDFAQLGETGLGSSRSWFDFGRHALRGSAALVRYAFGLKAEVKAFGPDIVHSNGIKMHILGALVKPSTASLVWHFHDYPSARPVTSRLVRSLRSRCGAVIAVSNHVAEDIRRTLGDSIDVRVIWNSVDLQRFAPDGPVADLAGLAGLPPASPGTATIGLVATFARWKGHTLFLDMLRALAKTNTFRAYIIGGPLYETPASQVSFEQLKAVIEQYGLADRVGMTGFTDSASALRALDIVVHASTKPEPFGLVIAEAMAIGKPVVISGAGGVSELVSDGSTGLVYPAGRADDMAHQVRRLLEDRPLRASIGSAAHKSAAHQFHKDRFTRQVIDLYGSVSSGPAARSAA
jgi:glycosyltransferase involved in cell wall biosynthesis